MESKNQTLNKRLAAYSATAGALVTLSSVSQGQIIYSGELNHVLDPSGETFYLDLDDNGINDFESAG